MAAVRVLPERVAVAVPVVGRDCWAGHAPVGDPEGRVAGLGDARVVADLARPEVRADVDHRPDAELGGDFVQPGPDPDLEGGRGQSTRLLEIERRQQVAGGQAGDGDIVVGLLDRLVGARVGRGEVVGGHRDADRHRPGPVRGVHRVDVAGPLGRLHHDELLAGGLDLRPVDRDLPATDIEAFEGRDDGVCPYPVLRVGQGIGRHGHWRSTKDGNGDGARREGDEQDPSQDPGWPGPSESGPDGRDGESHEHLPCGRPTLDPCVNPGPSPHRSNPHRHGSWRRSL